LNLRNKNNDNTSEIKEPTNLNKLKIIKMRNNLFTNFLKNQKEKEKLNFLNKENVSELEKSGNNLENKNFDEAVKIKEKYLLIILRDH